MPRKALLVKLTVLIPAETKRALERLARARAWSVGTYVRFMLLEHLHKVREQGETDATRKAEEAADRPGQGRV